MGPLVTFGIVWLKMFLLLLLFIRFLKLCRLRNRINLENWKTYIFGRLRESPRKIHKVSPQWPPRTCRLFTQNIQLTALKYLKKCNHFIPLYSTTAYEQVLIEGRYPHSLIAGSLAITMYSGRIEEMRSSAGNTSSGRFMAADGWENCGFSIPQPAIIKWEVISLSADTDFLLHSHDGLFGLHIYSDI